jgi:hypothetical protein
VCIGRCPAPPGWVAAKTPIAPITAAANCLFISIVLVLPGQEVAGVVEAAACKDVLQFVGNRIAR